jgi:hypothetical protein
MRSEISNVPVRQSRRGGVKKKKAAWTRSAGEETGLIFDVYR